MVSELVSSSITIRPTVVVDPDELVGVSGTCVGVLVVALPPVLIRAVCLRLICEHGKRRKIYS